MTVRAYREIHRRKSRQIRVGAVPVGGDAPITVQSMTNTPTSDAKATIAQVQALEEAGADIVRVSCPDEESTAALREIVRAAKVPIVADIHFHYRRAIEAAEAGAACLRINPGNIGNINRVREVVRACEAQKCRFGSELTAVRSKKTYCKNTGRQLLRQSLNRECGTLEF